MVECIRVLTHATLKYITFLNLNDSIWRSNIFENTLRAFLNSGKRVTNFNAFIKVTIIGERLQMNLKIELRRLHILLNGLRFSYFLKNPYSFMILKYFESKAVKWIQNYCHYYRFAKFLSIIYCEFLLVTQNLIKIII